MRAYSNFEKYLGIPILTSKRNTRAFNFLIAKLRSRLANWKVSTLSLAGRLTLISAVTTAIPTHIMQNTMLPSKVCKEIEKINKNFLQGRLHDQEKDPPFELELCHSPQNRGWSWHQNKHPQKQGTSCQTPLGRSNPSG